jgi:hypothetical protein
VVKRVALGLVLVVVAVAGWAWWRIGRLDVQQVRPGLWMLSGVGGNVGVLATDEGVVVVDTMTFVRQGEAILERIGRLADQRDVGRFGLGRLWFAPYLDRRFVIRRAWQEASAPPG